MQILHEQFAELWYTTTCFKVKNADEIGKPSLAFAFTTSKNVGDNFSFYLASAEPNSKIAIDFGDGELKDFTLQNYINTRGGNQSGTIAADTIRVYAYPGTQITQIQASSCNIKSIDLTELTALENLQLNGNELTEINLEYNSKLSQLNLSNNRQLENLDLDGHGGKLAYWKLALYNLNVGNCALTELNLANCKALQTLVFSNNKLTRLDISMAEKLQSIEGNTNNIADLDISKATELTQLRMNDNQLSHLDISKNTKLTTLWIPGNNFRFSTLPNFSGGVYMYSSQRAMQIKRRGKTIDLSAEYAINGSNTTYTWKKKDSGVKLFVDEDYTVANGVTTFLDTDLDSVYCEMTNPAFSSLTLKTTNFKPMAQPTDVIATLELRDEPGTEATLRLAARESNTDLYVDWGDGQLQECVLDTTYTAFQGTVGEAKALNFYSYEPEDNGVTILSTSDLSIKRADVSQLKDLYCLTLINAGLKEIDLSHNSQLSELNLQGNRLSTLNVSHNPELTLFGCGQNELEELDLSQNAKIKNLYVFGNKLWELHVDNMPNLFTLSCAENQLSELDVTHNPELQTLTASGNKLSQIDLEQNEGLRVVDLRSNQFTFSTLPLKKEGWSSYYYTAQADLGITFDENQHTVDLSEQADVDGTPTVFVWLTESGDTLVENEDYTITCGVTTFCKSQSEPVYCVLSNECFDGLTLKTNTIKIDVPVDCVREATVVAATARIVDGQVVVTAPTGTTVAIYDLGGAIVSCLQTTSVTTCIPVPTRGVYIVCVGGEAHKLTL